MFLHYLLCYLGVITHTACLLFIAMVTLQTVTQPLRDQDVEGDTTPWRGKLAS